MTPLSTTYRDPLAVETARRSELASKSAAPSLQVERAFIIMWGDLYHFIPKSRATAGEG